MDENYFHPQNKKGITYLCDALKSLRSACLAYCFVNIADEVVDVFNANT